MRTVADLLRGHAFFAGLPEATTSFIAGCGRNVVVEAGAYLLREGDPADRFFILRHGRVALEHALPGRPPQLFLSLGPDDVLGTSWLVEPYRSHHDARALTQVRAVAFDAACLRAKCDAEPAVGYALMKRFVPELVRRMQSARMQALDLYGPAA